jgi:hypothetical protein
MYETSSRHDPIVLVKSDPSNTSFLNRIRSPFPRLSSPNKKIAAGILTVLLIFGVGVGVYVSQQPTQLRPQAVEDQNFVFNPDTTGALAQSLVAYWKFNEASGNTAGDSTTNNLTLNINPTSSGFVGGKIGNALGNNGNATGASMSASLSSPLDFIASDNFSTSFWLSASSIPNFVRLIEATDPGGIGIEVTPQGAIRIVSFGIYDSGVPRWGVWENVVTPGSNWSHYVVTYNSTDKKASLYKNGTLVAAINYTAGWLSGNKTLYVAGDKSYPLYGKIDEVGIWEKTLSQQEVSDLYNNGNGNIYAPKSPAQTSSFNPDPSGTLIQGLISYWKMDETTGNTVADSLGKNNASTTNGASIIAGKINNGRGFNGSSNSVGIGNSDSLKGFNQFSASTWFKLNATSNGGIVANSSGGYNIWYNSASGIRAEIIKPGPVGVTVFGGVLPIGVWKHIVMTYDQQMIKLYVDGALINSKAETSVLAPQDNNGFRIGEYAGVFNGQIDEVGVWNRALSLSEITNLYNYGGGNTYSPQSSPTPTGATTSMTIETPSANFTTAYGNEFEVKVQVRADIENANLFVAKINFPSNLLQVVSIDRTQSFITSWTPPEPFYDNNTGQIELVGAVPSPGYKTNFANSLMSIIKFKTKAGGSGNIDLTDNSQIFSNTTNSNILQTKNDATFTITGGPSPSPQSSASASASPSPSAASQCGQKGDGNGDCVINLQDLSVLLTNLSALNPTSPNRENLDFNSDKRINTFDFSNMGEKLFQLNVVKRKS